MSLSGKAIRPGTHTALLIILKSESKSLDFNLNKTNEGRYSMNHGFLIFEKKRNVLHSVRTS